ncbi:Surface antigen variable number repeat-containing protein [Candidatus Kryptonium thompsonii]|nr:Surface antigen variable number repeat-containing protein [Candidatus Kryptonium thompsoni]
MLSLQQLKPKILKFLLLSFTLVNSLLSDEGFKMQDKFIVRKVVFIGNEKTKSEIIARELSFSVGSEFDTSKIEYNENRVYGTGLFNKVKIWFERDSTGSDSVDVYVWVNERWYIWLFPIFGWRDRDLKKLYYGAGFLHSNFRGRNEKLVLSFALGYDPWIGIEYLNPWILGSKYWFYSIEAYYQRVRSRSQMLIDESGLFHEDNFVFNFLFGKRFGLYKKLWASAGFKNIRVTGDFVHLKTISPSGNDKILVIGSGFRYDTRDIPVYPNVGVLFNFAFKLNRLLNYNDAFFVQSGMEFQGYRKVWVGLIAGRFFVLNSFGRKIPIYSHYYFGYEERLRGYFNKVSEGENIFGGTVEYRIPVVKQKFFKWKAQLEEFSILRFGLDFAIFGDIGRTWFNNEKFFKLNYWKGYGVGLNFILPYDLILSVEFAKNDAGKGQFILDFRGSFR